MALVPSPERATECTMVVLTEMLPSSILRTIKRLGCGGSDGRRPAREEGRTALRAADSGYRRPGRKSYGDRTCPDSRRERARYLFLYWLGDCPGFADRIHADAAAGDHSDGKHSSAVQRTRRTGRQRNIFRQDGRRGGD